MEPGTYGQILILAMLLALFSDYFKLDVEREPAISVGTIVVVRLLVSRHC